MGGMCAVYKKEVRACKKFRKDPHGRAFMLTLTHFFFYYDARGLHGTLSCGWLAVVSKSGRDKKLDGAVSSSSSKPAPCLLRH